MKDLKMLLVVLPISLVVMASCKKKIYGCLDSKALNFSEIATEDAGSCVYEKPDQEIPDEVIVSNIINIGSGDWTVIGASYNTTITWAKITQDVLDKGAVSAYIGDASSGEWTPLPLTESAGLNDISNTTYINYSVGTVEVWNEDSDGFLPTSSPGALDLKLVILK